MANDTTHTKTQSLLTFPCEFIIKAFGAASDEFEVAVISIIKNHIKDLHEDTFRTRPSKDGKYFAITITVHVDSQEQLDQIYRELSANPLILMAL